LLIVIICLIGNLYTASAQCSALGETTGTSARYSLAGYHAGCELMVNGKWTLTNQIQFTLKAKGGE
jgi:hypothetical protein